MTDASPRYELPFLAAGQAQKEVLHNEALLLLDALVQPVVETVGDDTPPAAPSPGQCWIVGESPAGAWAGHAGALACSSEGGWRFVAAQDGMLLWRRDHGRWQIRNNAQWSEIMPVAGISVDGAVVVGPQRAAIAAPAGGAMVDASAREAISAILGALRGHGLIAS